jgi:hypothetical protein
MSEAKIKKSYWKRFKEELITFWKKKRKPILLTYFSISFLIILLDIINSLVKKKNTNFLLSLEILISLFPVVFILFSFSQLVKENKKTDKIIKEIVKKAKVNNPQKYRKANIIGNCFMLFWVLSLIALLIYAFKNGTFAYDEAWNWKKSKISLMVIFLTSLFIFYSFLHLLYCKEISEKRDELIQ